MIKVGLSGLASAIKRGRSGELYESGRQSSSQLWLIMESNPSPKGRHEPPNHQHLNLPIYKINEKN